MLYATFMRAILTIAAILLIAFLYGFTKLTNPVVIKGHIRKNPKQEAGYVEYITVFVKGGEKVLAKTITDTKGDFELTFTPVNEKSFDFYCAGVGIDTMLVATVERFVSDNSDMTFYLPAEPAKSKIGKVLCPKCKRADKVFKIVYGDNPIVVQNISASGDTTYSPLYKGKYYETCTERPAKYYCDRDKIKF
jgi:hypothetical protein